MKIVDKETDRYHDFNNFMRRVSGYSFGSNKEMIDFMEENGEGLIRKEVFDAMRNIDRRDFLPETHYSCYHLSAQPIGHNQTCSAPYVVAIINEALDLKPDETVGEIGAGCGYHVSTVAAQMGKGEVHTVEIIEELAKLAEENIEKVKKKVDMADVHVHFGDASEGFKEKTNFDKIYLTSSAPANYNTEILLKQLNNNGRLVIPLQEDVFGGGVYLFELGEECVSRECIAEMAFVPLTGKRGQKGRSLTAHW